MKIRQIITQDVGPLINAPIVLENDWSGELETRVLFTGPNGCGKSTILRGTHWWTRFCPRWNFWSKTRTDN